MTLENLANIADIVGVIAIIGSLIYVARQLRQNTEMMRAESRNEIAHSHQQELHTVTEYPEIMKGLLGADSDLDDNVVRLHMWLTSHCRAREHEWLQLRSGALDQSAWETYSSAMTLVLSGRKARAWWNVMRPSFDEGFVKNVDEILEKSRASGSHKRIGKALSDALS
jgi:hypothetical protein